MPHRKVTCPHPADLIYVLVFPRHGVSLPVIRCSPPAPPPTICLFRLLYDMYLEKQPGVPGVSNGVGGKEPAGGAGGAIVKKNIGKGKEKLVRWCFLPVV